MRKVSLILLACTVLSLVSNTLSSAQSTSARNATPCGETIFALTTGNRLLSFSSDSPGTIISSNSITGLLPGESLIGIDYRPAVEEIFGLSNQNRVYIIDSTSGVARLASSLFVSASGAAFGFDFNPVPDRLRVTSESNQNLRINVQTGETTVDGPLAFAAGDVNVVADPNIVGSAYANNFAGTTTTTLYGIDSNLDILVIQNPPNNGTLNTVGSLGVNTTDLVGFDIVRCDLVGFAALTLSGENVSRLYRIDLTTGAATLIGTIGGGELIRAIAVR